MKQPGEDILMCNYIKWNSFFFTNLLFCISSDVAKNTLHFKGMGYELIMTVGRQDELWVEGSRSNSDLCDESLITYQQMWKILFNLHGSSLEIKSSELLFLIGTL